MEIFGIILGILVFIFVSGLMIYFSYKNNKKEKDIDNGKK